MWNTGGVTKFYFMTWTVDTLVLVPICTLQYGYFSIQNFLKWHTREGSNQAKFLLGMNHTGHDVCKETLRPSVMSETWAQITYSPQLFPGEGMRGKYCVKGRSEMAKKRVGSTAWCVWIWLALSFRHTLKGTQCSADAAQASYCPAKQTHWGLACIPAHSLAKKQVPLIPSTFSFLTSFHASPKPNVTKQWMG